MKNATMFYIHPGKKKLHGIEVNTVIIDGLNDNAVADVLDAGILRSEEAIAHGVDLGEGDGLPSERCDGVRRCLDACANANVLQWIVPPSR